MGDTKPTTNNIPFPLNSKPTGSGREFREKTVPTDWDNNPVVTVHGNINQQTSQPHYHTNNGWTTRGEKLVRYWQEECRLYAWMYEQNATYYSRLNRTLGIASIALSAITGTTLFNQSASESDTTSSNILIGLGVSSIASTILSGFKELLDLNSLITQNTNAARENSSIVMDIDEQMNIDRADRIDGREFLKSIKDRKNSLIQNGPIIPSRQWKQVHRKIQSKEQLGFLNREVFNEYLEQSVDINKLQFGNTTNGINLHSGVDYGTPSSNSTGLDGCPTPQHGSVTIDMQADEQTLSKRATLAEKLAYYGGIRAQVLPVISYNPTAADLEVLGKEIENIQPRTAARKAMLENNYELERLLSKTGELKNKDRQQIASLRDKARTFRENYNKLINVTIANYNSIIDCDSIRVSKIIRAYRDGRLSEPELFRIIQLDLIEIDKEAFVDETRILDMISKTQSKLNNRIIQEPRTQRYPFRNIEPIENGEILNNLCSKLAIISQELRETDIEIDRLHQILVNCQDEQKSEINKRIVDLHEIRQALLVDYDTTVARINEIEQTNMGYARLESINIMQPNNVSMREITSTQCSYSPSAQQQFATSAELITNPLNKVQNTQGLTSDFNRPSSTAPSDDEFIENMISDNLCAKQLRDVIKPIAQPTSPGQDMSASSSSTTNTTKSPKRRSSKYDAQMRYQTGRI